MKKLAKVVVVVTVVLIVVISILAFSGHLRDFLIGPKPNHYTYTLDIKADANLSYNLIISIPEGWDNFTEALKEKSGNLTYTMTEINGQPSLNLTGRGDSFMRFFMESENYIILSFVKNSNKSGMLIYLERSNTLPISIEMQCIYTNLKTNSYARYLIRETLNEDGWIYVYMSLAVS